jgi:hypothetical protein
MASVHPELRGFSSMQSAWSVALSVALLSSVPAATAYAGEPPAGSSEAKAKHHFHLAQTHKELREYEKAAEEFLNAYELYKDPAFFFNAGEMYRLSGDNKLAVKYFKMYLTQHPSGRVATAAKSTIRQLQTKAELQIAKEKLAEESERRKALEEREAKAKETRAAETAAATRAREDAEAKARREVEAALAKAKRDVELAEAKAKQAAAEAVAANAAAEKAKSDAASAQQQKPAATPVAAKDDGSWSVEKRLKVAGIATGAVGALSLGVGAYFGINSASDNTDLETLHADRQFNPDTIDDRDSSATAFYVLTGVGAAALITGGVLYYLGDGASESGEEQTAFSLSPMVTTDGASISCWGSF